MTSPIVIADYKNIFLGAILTDNFINAKFALDNGVDVNDDIKITMGDHKCGFPVRPLYYVATYGSEKMLDLLLRYKADPNGFGPNQSPPIYGAASYIRLEHIKMLHKWGADLTIVPNVPWAREPIHHDAISRNNPELFKFLVELGCDLETKNSKGETAAEAAVKQSEHGNPEFKKFVRSKGLMLPVGVPEKDALIDRIFEILKSRTTDGKILKILQREMFVFQNVFLYRGLPISEERTSSWNIYQKKEQREFFREHNSVDFLTAFLKYQEQGGSVVYYPLDQLGLTCVSQRQMEENYHKLMGTECPSLPELPNTFSGIILDLLGYVERMEKATAVKMRDPANSDHYYTLEEMCRHIKHACNFIKIKYDPGYSFYGSPSFSVPKEISDADDAIRDLVHLISEMDLRISHLGLRDGAKKRDDYEIAQEAKDEHYATYDDRQIRISRAKSFV